MILDKPRLREDACFGINYVASGDNRPVPIVIHLATLDPITPNAFTKLRRQPGEALCNRKLQLMNDHAYMPDDSEKRCARCYDIAYRMHWLK